MAPQEWRTLCILVSYWSHMGQYMLTTQATMQIWMNSYGNDFASLARAQGLCSSLTSVVNFIVGPAGGALSDCIGRKPMMYVGPVADLAQRLITLPLMDARSEGLARVLFGSLAGATGQSHATALADVYSSDPVQLGIWQSRLAMGSTVMTMVLPVASSALSIRNLRLPLLISVVACLCNVLLISTTVTETLRPAHRKPWSWSSSNPLSMVQLFCKGGRLRVLCAIAMVESLVNTATRVGGGGGALLDIYQAEHLGWGLGDRGQFASVAAMLTVPGYLVMPLLMRAFGASALRGLPS